MGSFEFSEQLVPVNFNFLQEMKHSKTVYELLNFETISSRFFEK